MFSCAVVNSLFRVIVIKPGPGFDGISVGILQVYPGGKPFVVRRRLFVLKLLVIGEESQVGTALCELLTQEAIPFEGITDINAELQAGFQLARFIDEKQITFIVNVDHLEGFAAGNLKQRELEQHHVIIPQQLAKVAESAGVPLVQLSDYQVFSGRSDNPYTEDDEPHAQSLYGLTRWQGELSVQRFTSRYLILRSGVIFCETGANYLTDLLAQWHNGEGFKQSTNTRFSPTPVADLARVLVAIIKQLDCGAEVWGVYHYCSADMATPYDFAEVLLAARAQFYGEQDIEIIPVEREISRKGIVKTANSEAINTVMSCQKVLNTFGIRQRPWRGELTRMIEELEKA